jgi:hypothetical protein
MRKPGIKELKPEDEEHLFKLKLELTEQEREERLLDTHLKWIKQVNNKFTDFSDHFFIYIEHQKCQRISRQPKVGIHIAGRCAQSISEQSRLCHSSTTGHLRRGCTAVKGALISFNVHHSMVV